MFITVPADETDEISEVAPHVGGFGSVRVGVRIGQAAWKTSVFPDSSSGCFVLPIKKPVRISEAIDVGDTVDVELTVLMD